MSNAFLSRLSFPVAAGLALLAPELVGSLLGEQWLPMVPAFRVLTVFAVLDPLRFSLAGLFPAVGRPDLTAKARAGQLVFLGLGLPVLGSKFGITGVALAVAMTTFVGFVSMALMSRRFIRFSLKRLLLAPLVATSVGAALAAAVVAVIPGSAWAEALLTLGILTSVYVSGLLILEPKEMAGLYSFVRTRPNFNFNRNALELVHLIGDCAPRFVVSSRAYLRLRHRLSRNPQRFRPPVGRAIPFTAEDWRERKLVSSNTDLCVEAFPGSGSSFVSNCLRRAVEHPTNIESHFHRTAQLKRAIGLGVPVVVLVRDPIAACQSLSSKEPRLAQWLIILRWIHYHRWLVHRLDRFDVFLFNEITADVDAVRRRSPAVAAMVERPIIAHDEFRRPSPEPKPLDIDRWSTMILLKFASSLYRQITDLLEG